MLYLKVSEIIFNFIKNDGKNCNRLRDNLSQFKNIFQYVYSCVYPGIYCSAEQRGFHLKSTFQVVFKTWKGKEKLEHVGRSPQNYAIERQTSFEHEQKPVNIDYFNDEEEKTIKKGWKKKKKEARGSWKKQSAKGTK